MLAISRIFEMSEITNETQSESLPLGNLLSAIFPNGESFDENGKVYSHVFTPPNWTCADVATCLCATGHTPGESLHWVTSNGKTLTQVLNQWRREQSQAKRAERWQKIRRRQRRAAQRR